MLRQRSTSKGKHFDRLVPEKVNLSDYQIHMVEDQKNESLKELDLNEQLRVENSQAKYNSLLKQKLMENKSQSSLFVYQRQPSKYKPYIFENECPSPVRKINKAPYKILDAPKLKDDFYYQLVDWSMSNQIGVGLGNSVYTWNALTNETTQLLEIEAPVCVSCIKWCDRSEIIAIGDDTGAVRIYDIVKAKILKTYENHNLRVGCLDWNGCNITSGSRDKSILFQDIRTNNDYELSFQSHKQEVCGLQWSPNEQFLASGGNDNNVMIQSIKMPNQSMYVLKDHIAAVKALAWSPHQPNILCSGGGTTDKCLKFWNTSNGQLQNSVDTGSQICNMKWSTNTNELVTSHGYSLNQVAVWKMPKIERIATLYGHSFRVLYLSLSPDGENIVTGSGDETLRFWKLFPSKINIQILLINLNWILSDWIFDDDNQVILSHYNQLLLINIQIYSMNSISTNNLRIFIQSQIRNKFVEQSQMKQKMNWNLSLEDKLQISIIIHFVNNSVCIGHSFSQFQIILQLSY